MQFWDPEKEKKFSLDRTLEQLGQGIAGNLQRRRQSLDTKFGLRALGYSDPEAEMLSGMNPQVLNQVVKQKMLEPTYKSNYQLAQKLVGGEKGGAASVGGQSSQGQGNALSQSTSKEGGLNLPDTGMLTDKQLQDTLNQYNQQANRQLKKDLAEKKSLEENWKAAGKENKELNASIEANKKLENDLDDLIGLNATGKLIQGKEHQALKSLGLEKFFTNDPTQLASKSIERMGVELLKQVKTGGKVTDFVFNSLKASLPSLVNTKSGLDTIAKVVKSETMLDRKYKEMKMKVKGEYQKKGLRIPELTIDEEVRTRMKPVEQKINNARRKLVGNTIVNAIPEVKANAQKLPDGSKRRFNGILLQKEGKDWFIIPEGEENE